MMDVVLGATALVATLPVQLAVAAAVRWQLGRPVLIRQRRAGRHGRPIVVRKFRSMTDERDEAGELLPDERRLTPFGGRLRATSLDELPQLWSVVKGEMSLVGPRPLPLAYTDRYNDEQRRRLETRPGLTGWAQINGRTSLPWSERIELDLWYIEHRSWRLDLQILLRTAAIVFGGEGLYKGETGGWRG